MIKRKKKLAKKPKKKLGLLKRKLDSAFGKMIMARDAGKRCISCIVPGTQPGHFMRRGLQATRWHPKNVHGQCFQCNCVESGNPFPYAEAIDKIYGMGTADELKRLARTSWKPSYEAIEHLLAAAQIGPEQYEETWKFYGSEGGH